MTRPAGTVKALLPWAVCLVLACGVFAPALFAGFVNWDDREMVVRNPSLAPGHLAEFTHSWTGPTNSLYAPLTYTTYTALAAASYAIGDTLQPALFHAANLLTHAAGAVLLWLLLRRLGGDDRSALLGALLWTVHPLQAEPVSWVGSLNTCLCGTLAIAALLLQTIAWTAETAKPRAGWFSAAALAFVLSLCAKPASIGMPLVVLGIDRFVLRRSWRETLAVSLAAGVLALPFVLAGSAAQPGVSHFALTPPQRVVVVGHTLAWYLYKIVVPFGQTIDPGLSPDVVVASPLLRLGGLALLPIVGVLLWQWRRRPWLVGAACVFLGAVGPVSGARNFEFQNVSTVGDRYAYLALVGVAIVVAIGLSGRLKSAGRMSAALVVVAFLGVLACFATLKWHNSDTLERDTLAANPQSLAALVLQGDRAIDTGDLATEEAVCRQFLDRRPMFFPINSTLAYLLMNTNRPGEAATYFRRAIAVKADPVLYNDLAVALMRDGQYAAALKSIDSAIALLPGDPRPQALRDEVVRRMRGSTPVPTTSTRPAASSSPRST